MNVDSKTTLMALNAFAEAYADACKPICRELGMPQMAFDILMFLHNNPEHCTAIRGDQPLPGVQGEYHLRQCKQAGHRGVPAAAE